MLSSRPRVREVGDELADLRRASSSVRAATSSSSAAAASKMANPLVIGQRIDLNVPSQTPCYRPYWRASWFELCPVRTTGIVRCQHRAVVVRPGQRRLNHHRECLVRLRCHGVEMVEIEDDKLTGVFQD